MTVTEPFKALKAIENGLKLVRDNRSITVMTFQEALEYLNLPPNSSNQLVRKRYLELKKDYLKAIINAPSEHFSSLYQENLDKIEEAYVFLTEGQALPDDSDSKVLRSIQQVQQVVDTFPDEGKESSLNPEAQDKIQNYIDKLDGLQEILREEENEKASMIAQPSDRWDLKQNPDDETESSPDEPEQVSADLYESHTGLPKELKEITVNQPEAGHRWYWALKLSRLKLMFAQIREVFRVSGQSGLVTVEGAFIEKWVIEILLSTSFASNAGSRRQFYGLLIVMVVLGILALGIIGAIYIVYPLF